MGLRSCNESRSARTGLQAPRVAQKPTEPHGCTEEAAYESQHHRQRTRQEDGSDVEARSQGTVGEKTEAREGEAWDAYGVESRTCKDESRTQHVAAAAEHL